MASEGALWETAKRVWSPYGRLVRIENLLEKGTPDSYYNFNGATGWMEFKQIDAWPKGPETNVQSGLTLEQVMWLEAEKRSNGKAWVLAKVEVEYFLFAPAGARLIYAGQPQRIFRSVALFSTKHLAKEHIRWLR